MTPAQFRAAQTSRGHGDPATWMPADFDSYEVLAENTGKTPQPVSAAWRRALKAPATPAADGYALRTCWFCGAENDPTARICGFCHHHESDGPGHTPAPKQRPESCHFHLAHDPELLAWVLTYDGNFWSAISANLPNRPMDANAAQQWADGVIEHPQPWQPDGAAYRAVPADPTP